MVADAYRLHSFFVRVAHDTYRGDTSWSLDLSFILG